MTKTTNQKRFKNWLASLETESNYKKFLTKDMIRKLLSLKDEKLEKTRISQNNHRSVIPCIRIL